jgi:hypothetical protein
VAYEKIAADLAAVYYAATLTPNPTLDKHPDPDGLATYQAKGRQLASTLLTPNHPAPIRCPCQCEDVHKGHRRALVAVHDHDLVVVRGPRGPYADGVRLLPHLLVDIPLALREGAHSVCVFCPDCGAQHHLSLRWLSRARRNEVSRNFEPFVLSPFGNPLTPEGNLVPRHPDDLERLAFAETIGLLDSSPLLIALRWPYAFEYKNHFGFKPPHEAHLLRLIGDGDPRIEMPDLKEHLIPQWRRLQLDPEERRQQQFDGPLVGAALRGLQHFLTEQDDPREREDFLLTMQQLLQEDDFTALQRSLIEETP